MYNSSVDFVVKSIQKSPLVNLNGLIYQEYHDFFDDIWFEKIFHGCHLYNFDSLENQGYKPRKKLSYHSRLSKELKILFSHIKITQALEKIYQTDLKFSTCDLWQDFQEYFLHPHTDDVRVKLAVQIYVGESKTVGTKFFSPTVATTTEIDVWKQEYLQHEIKEIMYEKNHGYSLLNNEQSWHGVAPNQVDNRLSVYVRYK